MINRIAIALLLLLLPAEQSFSRDLGRFGGNTLRFATSDESGVDLYVSNDGEIFVSMETMGSEAEGVRAEVGGTYTWQQTQIDTMGDPVTCQHSSQAKLGGSKLVITTTSNCIFSDCPKCAGVFHIVIEASVNGKQCSAALTRWSDASPDRYRYKSLSCQMLEGRHLRHIKYN